MSFSQSPGPRILANTFATIFVAFGINAVLRPAQALTLFEFQPPASAVDKQLVDNLMAIYGVRDIFMGAAIYAAAYFGTRPALGWILIAASSVAFADGFVCWMHGQGAWNHWGYAPMITIVGSMLLGLFD